LADAETVGAVVAEAYRRYQSVADGKNADYIPALAAVPGHLFGRVNSVYRWFGWGTLPLGSLLGGLVAHTFGLRATYFAGAAVMVAALLVAMRHVNTTSIVRALMSNRVSDGSDATPRAFRAAEDDLLDPW
jgi:hypothetical protein